MTRLEATQSEALRTRRPRSPRRAFSTVFRDAVLRDAALRDAALRDAARAASPTGPPGTSSPSRRAVPAAAGRPRRPAGGPSDEAERARDARPAVSLPPGEPPPAAPATPAVALRAAVRALPVAVEAFRARGGEALAIDLGRELSVELRRAPAGIEVVLRPAPALSRAAAAELPGLVGALRARGLEVARAEVRARGSPR